MKHATYTPPTKPSQALLSLSWLWLCKSPLRCTTDLDAIMIRIWALLRLIRKPGDGIPSPDQAQGNNSELCLE
uniref:Putative secreted protein n=1 Tax=Anopheles darlingi TaxID=43151 RepID=A0A2M4DGY2_ANODA